MSYFSNFPTITHNGKTQLTNVLRRFRFESSIKERLNLFYEYTIQDGDRPDTIADKYYGDAKYAWVVILFNEILDPLFDWPRDERTLNRFITDKYNSDAHNLIHEYQDSNGYAIHIDTYNALPTTERKTITKYQYELDLNEKKRNIKILDRKYLDRINNEITDILSDAPA